MYLILFLNDSFGQVITISKGENVPDDVCNVTSYNYIATSTDLDPNATYSVS